MFFQVFKVGTRIDKMSQTIAAHLQKRRLHGIRNAWMAVAAASLLLVPTLHALTLSRHSLACRRTHSQRYESTTTRTTLSAKRSNEHGASGTEGGSSSNRTRPSRKKRYKNRKQKQSKRSTESSGTMTTATVAATAAATTTTIMTKSKSSGKKYSTNAAAVAVATAAATTVDSHLHSREPNNLSHVELATHVSHNFLHGPNGFFKETHAKRQRLQEDNHVFGSDPSHVHQLQYLRELDRHPALVLNADYQPLSILPLSLWSWQETIKAVFNGKVTVVDVYPELNIRAVSMDVPLPSVIALTDYIKQPNQNPAFTRRNVYLRDGYICQYCGNRFMTQDLTLDHVYPRCYGGKLEWNNAVTCCKKCNARKGSTLPTDLRRIGMKLLKEPRVPSKYELASVAGQMYPRKGVHPTWEPYLGLSRKLKHNVEEALYGTDGFVEEDGREFEF